MNATLSEQATKTPWHLWAVGIASLCWNGFGAYDYTMSHVGGPEYFQAMGLDDEAFAWFEALPVWSVAAWAVGVWMSVAGSILLLLRSRYAAPAFLIAFVGALISFAYQFTSDRPASLEGGMATAMPIVILILVVAQWYYSRRMTEAGVLR